jgi:hypothetical protein
MRALSLDFERKAPSAKLGYGLVAIGGLVAALVVGVQLMVYQEIERYATPAPDAGLGRGERMLPRGVASESEALAGARTIVGHLAGPREKLFRALEAIQEPDVALLALTPDTQKRTLRIYAEARSFGAMLSYFRELEQSRAFKEVVLVEHEIQDNDPQRPLRFSLAATWGQ